MELLTVVFGSQRVFKEHLLRLGLFIVSLLLMLGNALGTEDTGTIQLRSLLYPKVRRGSAM